ncbi:MAG TPA: PQQ-binding-like beta-propeller repeat protein [Planctomycetota bacterium]|nr:PQQ-binding-like beta-propeller repeat protein [Planctomycetota bacterium]
MSAPAHKLTWMMSLALLASLGLAANAADKSEKKEEKIKKVKEDKKLKSEPKTPADLFTPTPAYEKQQENARNIAAEIEAEVAARAVPVPAGMDLEVDWYSPHINPQTIGRVLKGWVIDDVVLLETDKNSLLCINRADGVQKWRCELSGSIRYSPAVSRNNVIVNINNYLVGIEKNAGYIRWKLLPDFVMSSTPIIVDPAAYPKEYTKEWKNLESIYVGGWDGRFYSMFVRGRIGYFIKHVTTDNFSAPEFDLFKPWHKTHKNRGIITSNIILKDNILYYVADDQNVYAVTREGAEREPYYMLGAPTTGLTVTAPRTANNSDSVLNSIYVGARDNYVYCLDRLTLKKKWAYPAGVPANGPIYADEAATPYVYVPTADGNLNALKVERSRVEKGQPETPEKYNVAWKVKGDGAITASSDIVYIGTGRLKDNCSYMGIQAVNKETGKVLWATEPGSFFSQFLETQSAWSVPGNDTRIFAIASDNRLISLKEKVRDTGIRVIKPTAEPEAPKMPAKKAKAGDAPAADGAAPAEKKE